MRLIKGVLYVDHKHQRTHKYTVKNSGKKAKTVLIEYPLDPNWKLMAPKEPTEKTRELYRFAVEAEPGKPAMLEVVEEQISEPADRDHQHRRQHDPVLRQPEGHQRQGERRR